MTENSSYQNEAADAVVQPVPSRRSVFSYVKPALILLAALAIAWPAWRYLDGQKRQVGGLQSTVDSLQKRVAELQSQQIEVLETSRQSSMTVASLDSRLDGYDESVGKLTEQLQGGRVRFQLAAVENLLMAANERAQLQHDARGAISALELADQRLAALSEPRLFKLREAIAQERSALLAVPQPDLTSAALTLSSLIGRVPQMPLRTNVPQRFEQQRAQINTPADASWSQRAWAGALQALGSVFSVRRNNGPAPRLLPADEEAMVYQVLTLKLEGARVAMLREDATSYRDLCDSALRWLNDYFRGDDPGVMAARAELERLKAMRLNPSMPDITRSLALLRGFLDSSRQ